MDGTVLVADDDRTIRTVLTQALTRAGCKVHATSSLMTLMRWVEEGKGDLVISDVIMPDGNGLEALPRIAKERPGLPVIVISAQNTIMTAIQAAEAEAYDYLPKPFDLPDLMKRAARALETKRRVSVRKPEDKEGGDDLPLVGRTALMQALYRLVARVMNTDLAVLVTGESGTGKSLIARAIHDFSDRRTQPYIVVSAADLAGMDGPSTVLARAKGGSIVFDEVSDYDDDSQARIVRMLDSLGENAPRIMATSQADLGSRIEAGHIPPRPVLPARRRLDRGAGIARTGRRHPASGRAFPGPRRPRGRCRVVTSPPRRWNWCAPIAGPATCASSKTPCAASSSPPPRKRSPAPRSRPSSAASPRWNPSAAAARARSCRPRSPAI